MHDLPDPGAAGLCFSKAVTLISLPGVGIPAERPRSGAAQAGATFADAPALIEPPATAETSGYPCRVESLFLETAGGSACLGSPATLIPALMTIPNDVRTVRYPAESTPATSGGVRDKARRRL
jgi:hypothetical protein